MSTNWKSKYARRLEWMSTSVIREILKCAQAPGLISMAGGWPEADLFPVAEMDAVCHDVLARMPCESLQYGLTDGLPALRQALAEYMTGLGIPAKAENIVITSGSQQALDLMGRIMLDEGDTVLVERPTFLGATQSFGAYGARYVTVPLDDGGLVVEELERVVNETPIKFMYLIPTFQNPSGATLGLERRRRVIEIADRAGVPIIEDDPYGLLRFSGQPQPTLLSLDAARFPENAGGGYTRGNVVYLSTFSKILAPGLRLAWAVCPPEIAQQLVMAKQGADLHSNALAQTIALEFLRRGLLPPQIERIRSTYLERRTAMIEALEEHMPAGTHFTRPEGGLFLWVSLPGDIDTVALLPEAVAQQVAFVPGAPFFVDGGGRNTLRLTFASVSPDLIREGIRRLGALIAARLA
ncbi:MAG: aminotransferase-like domain-containing protein [Anaerolineae bacterium]